MRPDALEKIIATDKRGIFSILALFSTLGIFINSITLSSSILGALFSSTYFIINSIFLGNLLFEDESINFRLAFGLLSLFMLYAFSNALAMFIVALEIFPILFETKTVVVILALIMTAISLTNHFRMRYLRRST
jgi:hypothetical protein